MNTNETLQQILKRLDGMDSRLSGVEKNMATKEDLNRAASLVGQSAKQITDFQYWMKDEFQKFVVNANDNADKLVGEAQTYRGEQAANRHAIEELEKIHPQGQHATA